MAAELKGLQALREQRTQRAKWIEKQIRDRSLNPAVVVAGLSDPLRALADFVVDVESRIQQMEECATMMTQYLRWVPAKDSERWTRACMQAAGGELFKLQQCYSYSQPTNDSPNWRDVPMVTVTQEGGQ